MNERFPYGAFRARTMKMPAWQIAIIGALAAALVISLAVFATAVFLLAFPAILVIDWFYRWRNGKIRAGQPSPAQRDTVITTDYEVLPPDPANEERR
jgi:hypothetical protein